MEELLVLALFMSGGVAAVAMIAAVIAAAFAGTTSANLALLTRRVRRLEERQADLLARLEVAPEAQRAPIEAVVPSAVEVSEAAERTPEPPPPAEDPVELPEPPEAPESAPFPAWRPTFDLSPERIIVWVAAAVGGVLLVIAAGFALLLAAQYGLLRPEIRIAGVLAGASLTWAVANHFRGRIIAVPSALSGASVGALMGTVFGAFALYGYFSRGLTVALLLAITGVATLVAARYRDRFMAYLALFGAFFAPLATSDGGGDARALFVFLGVVQVGFVGLAVRNRWPDLIAVMNGALWLLFTGWTLTTLGPDWGLTGLVTAGVYGFVCWVVLTRKRDLGLPMVAALTGSLVAWLGVQMFWFLPMDAVFTDPRSGLEIAQDMGWFREFGVVFLALSVGAMLLLSRVRQDPVWAILAVVHGAVAVSVWTFGWTTYDAAALVLVVPGLLVFALAGLGLGPRTSAHSLVGLQGAWALTVLPLLHAQHAVALSVSIAGFLGVTVLVGMLTRSGVVLLGGVVALGFVGFVDQGLTTQPMITAGVLAGALGILGPVALLRRYEAPVAAHLTPTVAPMLFAPALLVAWESLYGWNVIGVLPVVLGVCALTATVVLRRRHRLPDAHPAILAGVALTLAGASFALPLQLEEGWLTVGWALEAAALAAVATRLRHPFLRVVAIGLGVLVAVRLVLNPYTLVYGDAVGWPVFNWTLYTWGLPTLALVVAGWWMSRMEDGLSRVGTRIFYAAAMLTGFALVNVQVSHAFQSSTDGLHLWGLSTWQEMARSISWGVYGLGLLVTGIAASSRSTRFAGFGFMMLGALKVFLVDTWSLPIAAKVGAYLALGVLLIFAALLFNWLLKREPARGEL